MNRSALPLSVLLLLVLATVPACSTLRPEVAGGLPDYSPSLVRELLEKESPLVLDVRSQPEFLYGHAPKARNIDIGSFRSRLHEVEALVAGDKSKSIVVYCTIGTRAAEAKRILVAAGYTRVTNLGGLRDWPR